MAWADRLTWVQECETPRNQYEAQTYYVMRLNLSRPQARCEELYEALTERPLIRLLGNYHQRPLAIRPLLEFGVKALHLDAFALSDEEQIANFNGLTDLALNVVHFRSNTLYLSTLKSLTKIWIRTSFPFGPLEKLRNLSNLTTMAIDIPELVDISFITPQAFPKLANLFLDSSPGMSSLSDFSPISMMTSLKYLSLANTTPRSFDFLSNLSNLESLNLTYTNISDLSVLRRLTKLQILNLSKGPFNTKITKLAPLEDMFFLQRLDLSMNDVSDIVPLMNMAHMETLNISGNNRIDDISAIRYMKYLKTFTYRCINGTIFDNEQQQKGMNDIPCENPPLLDLSPLRDLEYLESLTLTHNTIYDISPLSGLINLKELNLRQNLIREIKPLSNLKKLETILLGDNLVEDLTPLAELLSLKVLEVAMNPIRDLKPVRNLNNLATVNVIGTTIKSLEGLESKNNLTILWLDRTQISNLSPLEKNSALVTLSLAATPVEDISALSQLDNLTYLTLSDTKVRDLSAIADAHHLMSLMASNLKLNSLPQLNLPNLHTIDLSGTPLENLSSLQNLSRIALIKLSSTGLTSLEGAQNWKGLVSIHFENNHISDLSPLAELRPVFIEGRHNQIVDLTPLASLHSLRGLDLSHNLISSVAPLSGLVNLGVWDMTTASSGSLVKSFFSGLKLNGNSIQDISPLVALKRINRLELEGNQLEDLSVIKKISALEMLSVAGNKLTDLSPLEGHPSLVILTLGHNPITSLRTINTIPNLKVLFVNSRNAQEWDDLCKILNENKTIFDLKIDSSLPAPYLLSYFESNKKLLNFSIYQLQWLPKYGFKGPGIITKRNQNSISQYTGETLNYVSDGNGVLEYVQGNIRDVVQGNFRLGKMHGAVLESTFTLTPQGAIPAALLKGQIDEGRFIGEVECLAPSGETIGRGYSFPAKKAFYGFIKKQTSTGFFYFQGLTINSIFVGEMKIYYDQALTKIFRIAHYKHGKAHGPVQEYAENGTLMHDGSYRNDRKHGLFRYYFEDGMLKEEINYKTDIRDGPTKIYYPNGQINLDASYSNDVLNGPMKMYTPNGLIAWQGEFVNGVVQGHAKAMLFECDYEYYEGSFMRSRPIRDNGTHGVITDFSGIARPGKWADGAFNFDEGGSVDSCKVSSELPGPVKIFNFL